MDHAAQKQTSLNRTFAWLVGLTVAAAAAGAVFVFGLGPSNRAAVDGLPASPVRGMADPDAALGGGDRPVLQVNTGAAPASGNAAPDDSSSTTVASTAAVAPSTVPGLAPSSPSSVSTPTTAGPGDPTLPPSTGSTTAVAGGANGLTAVEFELARLTNELRTNPNGPLRREGAVIDCEGRIPIDPATGLYVPVGALTIDPVASLQVARDWSVQLTTNLQHRPQAGIAALQGAGIDVAAAGENIAYHNFPDKASMHFSGWRESDGHFCNMMDPTFTHLGVGEATRSDGFSFATQNFFSTR